MLRANHENYRYCCANARHILQDPDEVYCMDSNHWTRHSVVYQYFLRYLADDLNDLGVFKRNPSVYMVKFVDIRDPGLPILYKYVGSCASVAKRMQSHLEAVWTGDSRRNGSLLMTSTGHRLLTMFKGDLSFFRVEVLETGIEDDEEILHEAERKHMRKERAFALYGEGGLNIVDPVSYLYFLNGGVSLRHLQSIKFEDHWTCVDFVNNAILPLTEEKGISYHEYLESHQNPMLRDAYREVPDFYVAPTCNNCLWKHVLGYMQSKSSTSKEIKRGDQRPTYLHDGGDLYVFLNFLFVNLHKEARSWPFAAPSPR